MSRYHDFETRWREYDDGDKRIFIPGGSLEPAEPTVERLRAIEKAAGPLLTLDRITVNEVEAAVFALRAIARADAQLETTRCCVCGRLLTNPVSIAAGIGPICGGRI